MTQVVKFAFFMTCSDLTHVSTRNSMKTTTLFFSKEVYVTYYFPNVLYFLVYRNTWLGNTIIIFVRS